MSSALPITEVLVVADCWQTVPDAETVIHRAINAAAEFARADVGDAELAVMLTDDAGIRTLNSNWRGIGPEFLLRREFAPGAVSAEAIRIMAFW